MATPEQLDLEALLAAAATDRTRVPEFLSTLLDATVIVPGGVSESPDGTRRASIAGLVGADGASVQPFFTSEERRRETIEAIPTFEPKSFPMPCRALWEMTRGATLVLNPHSRFGKEFLPGEVASLLDGAAAMTANIVDEGTTVMVGRPARVPPGMEDALSAVFARHDVVDEAVLGWKVTPSTNDQSYLLVVIGAGDVREQVGDDLGRALVVYSQAHPVDVLYAAPGTRHLLSGTPPFYRRAARRRSLFGRRRA